jgi:hypothetical protein
MDLAAGAATVVGIDLAPRQVVEDALMPLSSIACGRT